MNPLRHGLLSARTMITSASRRATLESMAAEGKSPLSVIFYHRVADTHPNGWTITCRRFRKHVDYCQRHFDLIDLAEMQRRLDGGSSPRPAVSLTFDDGYHDNCAFALPMLVQRKIPCTYFVATANIVQRSPFPHDVAAGVPLAVNTLAEIREASDSGIEIGCHTRHHVDFSFVDDRATIRSEIIDAKSELEQMIGKRVRYFAFPYGMPEQLTQIAVDTVAEAGFDGFCSAYGGYNLVGQDSFHLRRFHGDPEMARLRNWLSFDSSKVRKEPKLNFYLPPNQAQPTDEPGITDELSTIDFATTVAVTPTSAIPRQPSP